MIDPAWDRTKGFINDVHVPPADAITKDIIAPRDLYAAIVKTDRDDPASSLLRAASDIHTCEQLAENYKDPQLAAIGGFPLEEINAQLAKAKIRFETIARLCFPPKPAKAGWFKRLFGLRCA